MDASRAPQAAGQPRLRFGRSIIAGALLSLIISVGFAYCRLALSTSGMSSDYITAGAVAVFFLLTAFLNPLLKLVHRPWPSTAPSWPWST